MPKNLQGSEICYTFALANEKNECTRLDSLAQLVEHNTFNVGVLGSSPRRITKERSSAMKTFTFLYYQFFDSVVGGVLFGCIRKFCYFAG